MCAHFPALFYIIKMSSSCGISWERAVPTFQFFLIIFITCLFFSKKKIPGGKPSLAKISQSNFPKHRDVRENGFMFSFPSLGSFLEYPNVKMNFSLPICDKFYIQVMYYVYSVAQENRNFRNLLQNYQFFLTQT